MQHQPGAFLVQSTGNYRANALHATGNQDDFILKGTRRYLIRARIIARRFCDIIQAIFSNVVVCCYRWLSEVVCRCLSLSAVTDDVVGFLLVFYCTRLRTP